MDILVRSWHVEQSSRCSSGLPSEKRSVDSTHILSTTPFDTFPKTNDQQNILLILYEVLQQAKTGLKVPDIHRSVSTLPCLADSLPDNGQHSLQQILKGGFAAGIVNRYIQK